MKKDKLLKLCIPFNIKNSGEETEENEDFLISGYASTNEEDRDGDIIASDAWTKSSALGNYLKNPVILAFHDHRKPIGRTVDHEITELGLKITAKISKAAGDIIELIKDEVLGAFSVGFIIKDADFDPKSGVFMIKELELFEISVVSIPANQSALFSIAKNFDSEEEYEKYKKQFSKSNSKETEKMGNENKTQPVDVSKLTAEIRAQIKADLEAEAKAKAEKEAAEKAEKENIANTATTAAERLIADVKKELEDDQKEILETLSTVAEAVKSNKEDLEKALGSKDSKMHFASDNAESFTQLTQAQKDGLLYASKIKGVPVDQLDSFKALVSKSGMEHWDSGVVGDWEVDYSTRVMNAMREQLVVEPLFQNIPMSAPTMYMPINPEAGDATWVHENAYRSSRGQEDETGNGTNTSTGETQNHQLDEQVLVARKLATREYIGYEEEEDSIVALAPVINDAVARRMARASDLALLRGTGTLTNTTAYDPITGLENRGASTTDVTVAGASSWATNFDEDAIVDMRRNLSIYGLDPNALTLICSHDLYYEIMKLPNFKTVDVLADRATIITGQVGSIFGIRVIVSQQFNNAAITAGTVGTTLAILVRTDNFVIGNHRSLMTEAARDPINQKRAIVSSRRFAFNDIISGQATVNLEIAS